MTYMHSTMQAICMFGTSEKFTFFSAYYFSPHYAYLLTYGDPGPLCLLTYLPYLWDLVIMHTYLPYLWDYAYLVTYHTYDI